jgi:peptide deformylase
MKKLKIITVPDPILRKKSIEIEPAQIKSKKIKALMAEMKDLMLEADGVGLAAPQIGLNIRLIAVNTADGPLCLINPQIKKKSWLREWGEEGCLSVPGVYGEVRRHKKISGSYLDLAGNRKKLEASGLLARILQHEIDHLDGILFIDKMRPIKNEGLKKTDGK